MEDKKPVKGIHASYIFVPTIIVTGIIHILIIVATILINIYSATLTAETNEASECINTVSSILTHSSKLSDTITTFVYTPEIPTGPNTYKVNEQPLTIYYEEIKNESRSPAKIMNVLNKYKNSIDEKSLENINTALNNLDYVIKEQAHALRLINSKIPLPENLISAIPAYELTEAELAYTKEEVKKKAIEILFEKEYSWAKRDVADYTNQASDTLVKAFNVEQENVNAHLRNLRVCLWIMIATIMVITVVFFIIIIKLLVNPIITFSKKINDNERLDDDKSMFEANFLAYSYNELLARHDKFEEELRAVAEKDSLTGLPNRYSYNEFLKKEIDDNQRACVFMLDLNNLKLINDTYGHDKGDELIKNASLCIKECFSADYQHCFRTGGDEFLVICNQPDMRNIDRTISRFKELQEKYNVSIAYGYSYSDNVKEIGYEKLVSEADKMMYINKEEDKKKMG